MPSKRCIDLCISCDFRSYTGEDNDPCNHKTCPKCSPDSRTSRLNREQQENPNAPQA